jgi:hypothetical protein
VLQARGRARFAEESLNEVVAQRACSIFAVATQNLHRDVATKRRISRAPNLAHAASPEALAELIAAERTSHRTVVSVATRMTIIDARVATRFARCVVVLCISLSPTGWHIRMRGGEEGGRMRRVAVAIVIIACGDVTPAPIIDPVIDAGADARPQIDAAPSVLSIDVSPLALSPKFSTAIFDYVVRCAAGPNPVVVTVVDSSQTTTTPVTFTENEDYVVRGYNIRCLPHDFPPITISGNGTPTPGLYLLNSQAYAMVLDTNGTPVWYSRGTTVMDVESLAPNHLSFFPDANGTFGENPASTFQLDSLDVGQVEDISAVATPTDGHELRLLPDGSHLLFTYDLIPHKSLVGLGTFGADETMVDCSIQQIDPQGKVTWTWRAGDHIDPISESVEPVITSTGEVDVFHCNSIDVDPIGNLLVSLREANALYYVDRATNKILWKLGGTSANKDGAAWIAVTGDPQGAFSEQHDARFAPNGHVTLFDDHGGGQTGVARGVDYYVDVAKKTATFSWQYLGTGQSKYEGSFRRQADGESVIGWGYVPKDTRVLTEVDAQGHDVFDVSLGGQVSYRAIKVAKTQIDLGLMRASAGK